MIHRHTNLFIARPNRPYQCIIHDISNDPLKFPFIEDLWYLEKVIGKLNRALLEFHRMNRKSRGLVFSIENLESDHTLLFDIAFGEPHRFIEWSDS
jgi:hypothetical protein